MAQTEGRVIEDLGPSKIDETNEWLSVISAQLKLLLLVQSATSAQTYGILDPLSRDKEIKQLSEFIERTRRRLND